MAAVNPFQQPAKLRFTDGQDIDLTPYYDQYIGLVTEKKTAFVASNNQAAEMEPIMMPDQYNLTITTIVVHFFSNYQPPQGAEQAPVVVNPNVPTPHVTYPDCPAWARIFFKEYRYPALTAALNTAYFLKCPRFIEPCSAFLADQWTRANFFSIAKCFTGSSQPNDPANLAMLAPFYDSQPHDAVFGDIIHAGENNENDPARSNSASTLSSNDVFDQGA